MQNLVVVTVSQVQAVLGTINPADIAAKRFSIARLESLMYSFSTNNQLVGCDDPGRIFSHVEQQSTSHSGQVWQIQQLLCALSSFTEKLWDCGDSLGATPGEIDCVWLRGLEFLAHIWFGWHILQRVARGVPKTPQFLNYPLRLQVMRWT